MESSPTESDDARDEPRTEATSATVSSTTSCEYAAERTCRGSHDANTVTALWSGLSPRSTCRGSQSESVSFSAMQYVYLPGCPITVRSNSPGMDAHAFIRMRRIARPMVALARLPGPNRFAPEFMPISSATGPLTITSTAAPPWLDEGAMRLNSGSSIASVAASTTGKYSGRQPAMTAFAAVLATVTSRLRSGIEPRTSSAGRPATSMNSCTR